MKIKPSKQINLTIDILRHDLINPVGAIRMTSDALLLGKFDVKTKENLETIKKLCDQEIELIRNSSTYLKLFINDLEKKYLDLNQLIKKLILDYQNQINEKKIKLEFLDNKKLKINADTRFEIALANLLSNAIKYSPRFGKVKIEILEKKSSVRILFYDNGPGVEDKERIFNRFEDENKHETKGSGLGLAIVKKIVEMHKGRVWIEDNIKGGSIFIIEIPKK